MRAAERQSIKLSIFLGLFLCLLVPRALRATGGRGGADDDVPYEDPGGAGAAAERGQPTGGNGGTIQDPAALGAQANAAAAKQQLTQAIKEHRNRVDARVEEELRDNPFKPLMKAELPMENRAAEAGAQPSAAREKAKAEARTKLVDDFVAAAKETDPTQREQKFEALKNQVKDPQVIDRMKDGVEGLTEQPTLDAHLGKLKDFAHKRSAEWDPLVAAEKGNGQGNPADAKEPNGDDQEPFGQGPRRRLGQEDPEGGPAEGTGKGAKESEGGHREGKSDQDLFREEVMKENIRHALEGPKKEGRSGESGGMGEGGGRGGEGGGGGGGEGGSGANGVGGMVNPGDNSAVPMLSQNDPSDLSALNQTIPADGRTGESDRAAVDLSSPGYHPQTAAIDEEPYSSFTFPGFFNPVMRFASAALAKALSKFGGGPGGSSGPGGPGGGAPKKKAGGFGGIKKAGSDASAPDAGAGFPNVTGTTPPSVKPTQRIRDLASSEPSAPLGGDSSASPESQLLSSNGDQTDDATPVADPTNGTGVNPNAKARTPDGPDGSKIVQLFEHGVLHEVCPKVKGLAGVCA